MSDDCCSGGSRGAEEDCANCGCCSHEEVDVAALGPEAVELAKKFDEVNANLVSALKARKEILEMVHTKGGDPGLKEKIDKVLSSRHPVLIQFVFGQ